jgi:hypothetical protein
VLPVAFAGNFACKRSVEQLEQLGNALLEPLFPVAKGVRLLGVSLSSLVVEEAERQPEFSPPG